MTLCVNGALAPFADPLMSLPALLACVFPQNDIDIQLQDLCNRPVAGCIGQEVIARALGLGIAKLND